MFIKPKAMEILLAPPEVYCMQTKWLWNTGFISANDTNDTNKTKYVKVLTKNKTSSNLFQMLPFFI